jgi:hypothetical protein
MKIAEQIKFVAWWKASVTDKGGRPNKTVCRPANSLSLAQAEKQTGMSQQHEWAVSKS